MSLTADIQARVKDFGLDADGLRLACRRAQPMLPRLPHLFSTYLGRLSDRQGYQSLSAVKIDAIVIVEVGYVRELLQNPFCFSYESRIGDLVRRQRELGFSPRVHMALLTCLGAAITEERSRWPWMSRSRGRSAGLLMRLINADVLNIWAYDQSNFNSSLLEKSSDIMAATDVLKSGADEVRADLQIADRDLEGAVGDLTSCAKSATAATHAATQSKTEALSGLQSAERTLEDLLGSLAQIADRAALSQGALEDTFATVNDTTVRVEALSQAVARIGSITGAISSIASQTTVLSLNAVIEAARAGESGRGFAVVASEVKHLAKETAEATIQIAACIREIQTATGGVVEFMHQVRHKMDELASGMFTIIESVKTQNASTSNIRAAVNSATEYVQMVDSYLVSVSERVGSTFDLMMRFTHSHRSIDASVLTLIDRVDRMSTSLETTSGALYVTRNGENKLQA